MVVFADTKKDSGSLPAGVRDVRAAAGNTIPMVFVTTADGSKGLVGVSYSAMKEDMRGTVRDVRKQLESVDVLASSGEADASGTATELAAVSTESEKKDDGGLFAESQEWTNASGQKIVAAINKVEGDTIQFVMPNGKYVPYPMAKLSAASQEKIKSMQK